MKNSFIKFKTFLQSNAIENTYDNMGLSSTLEISSSSRVGLVLYMGKWIQDSIQKNIYLMQIGLLQSICMNLRKTHLINSKPSFNQMQFKTLMIMWNCLPLWQFIQALGLV